MTLSCAIWNIANAGFLALTPLERWSAARNLRGADGSQHGSQYGLFLLAATVILVVLILLLWWVSYRQKATSKGLTRELFTENAMRRGLSPRERQILLAIVMRSGLAQSHDIFATASAFEQGAGKLLAECVRTRTAAENDRLKSEVAFLAEKLGFQLRRASGRGRRSKVVGSRDIILGTAIELAPRHNYDGSLILGKIVRNDAIDLAVELKTTVETQVGDPWRVRYISGKSVWEFDTAVVSCEGTRLVLEHVERARFLNRRRFPRVSVSMPAMVACFPVKKSGTSESRFQQGSGHVSNLTRSSLIGPEFVHGTVTELAGPGLRIEVPLEAQVGDRVLVMFEIFGVAAADAKTPFGMQETHVIEDVAIVQHCDSTGSGYSIAVELTGVDDAEIDELVRITNMIASKLTGERGDNEDDAQEMIVASASVQES